MKILKNKIVKFSKNNTKTTAIIMMLLLSLAAELAILPSSNALAPDDIAIR